MNHNILLVDDDPGAIRVMGQILAGTGQLRFATTGAAALMLAREAPPDLILLDAQMPGMSGFDVMDELKLDTKLAAVPVILVTSHCETAFEVAGFERGAADFIGKPFSAALVLARVRSQLRIKGLADELRRISTTDMVTSVANRRRFDDSLEREWRRARRSGDPLGLLMIDVDHFKAFNDRYGHPAGDTCLRRVAEALTVVALRPADLVARYGGEEFAVLLPATRRRGAEHMANAVLNAIEDLRIPHETSSIARHVTVSVGVACYDDESECWMSPTADNREGIDAHEVCAPIDLVRAADRALYAAKNAGRAQARLMDIADINTRQSTRDIAPLFRISQEGSAGNH